MKTEALLTPLYLNSLKPMTKEYTVHDVQCPGLGLRVQPGGARSWVMSERVNGRQKRITIGTWPDLSPEAARAVFYTRKSEQAVQPPQPTERKVTSATLPFVTLAAVFMKDRAAGFKPSSIGPFKAYLEAQLLPSFGNKPVGEITPADVATWFHAYSRDRPGGANQALGHFVTILNWGKDAGHLPHDLPNPAGPIRKNRPAARGRMLNFDQIKALAQVLDRPTTKYWMAAQAIRLILLTGCRRGEIPSLKWSDVKRSRLALRDAKTGPREVMLSAPAVETLTKLKRRTGNSVFVFPSDKSASGHIESVAASWATFRDRAGIPDDIRIHDLRHTYASHAILSGESLPTTGRLLGHASARSTKRYAHLDGSTLAKAAEAVSKEIDRLMRQG